jgi:hypothetical protein
MNTGLEGALRVLAVIGLTLTGSSIAIGTAVAPAIYPAAIA